MEHSGGWYSVGGVVLFVAGAGVVPPENIDLQLGQASPDIPIQRRAERWISRWRCRWSL